MDPTAVQAIVALSFLMTFLCLSIVARCCISSSANYGTAKATTEEMHLAGYYSDGKTSYHKCRKKAAYVSFPESPLLMLHPAASTSSSSSNNEWAAMLEKRLLKTFQKWLLGSCWQMVASSSSTIPEIGCQVLPPSFQMKVVCLLFLTTIVCAIPKRNKWM